LISVVELNKFSGQAWPLHQAVSSVSVYHS